VASEIWLSLFEEGGQAFGAIVGEEAMGLEADFFVEGVF
jgi:hypothetical protein